MLLNTSVDFFNTGRIKKIAITMRTTLITMLNSTQIRVMLIMSFYLSIKYLAMITLSTCDMIGSH